MIKKYFLGSTHARSQSQKFLAAQPKNFFDPPQRGDPKKLRSKILIPDTAQNFFGYALHESTLTCRTAKANVGNRLDKWVDDPCRGCRTKWGCTSVTRNWIMIGG